MDFERKWLQETVQDQVKALLSQELLQTNSSASVVERRFAGEKFLKAVKQQWNDHDSCMIMLSHVLMYLVRIALASDLVSANSFYRIEFIAPIRTFRPYIQPA